MKETKGGREGRNGEKTEERKQGRREKIKVMGWELLK